MSQPPALDTIQSHTLVINNTLPQVAARPHRVNITDRVVSKLFFVLLIIYVILYGRFITHGFHLGEFNNTYAVILIPIFLIDGFKSIVEVCMTGHFYTSTQDLEKVSVIIACKDGGSVLEATLTDLCRRFPKQNIIVASNGSTDSTCAIARRFGVQYLNIKEALGKVRSINSALTLIETPYTLIMDDDTLIKDAVIPTGALEAGYNAIAFRILPVREGWLSCLQLHEYRKTNDIGKRIQNKWGTVQNISGAIGLFTTRELKRQVTLHSGEFSGEDLQRTLLVHLAKDSKGVLLSDSIVYTEAPGTMQMWYSQRVFGWYPGLFANFLNFIRLMFGKKTRFSLRIDAFYNCIFVIALDILRAIALPVVIFYPWYFVVMYFTYIIFEFIFYVRMGRHEPLWVIFVYPFYGMMGLITRLVSFGVFVYRRLVVKLAGRTFLDDYRQAPAKIKMMSVVGVVLVYLFLFSIRFWWPLLKIYL